MTDFQLNVFDAFSEVYSETKDIVYVTDLFARLLDLYPQEYEEWTLSELKDELVDQFKDTDELNIYCADYCLYDADENEAILLDTEDWSLWLADEDDLKLIQKAEKEEPEEKECSCEHKEIEEAVNKLREILKKYGHDPNVGLCVFGFCD